MSKKAHVIRHVAFEDLGTLHEALNEAGYRVQYFDAGVDDLAALNKDTADLLVVLGGPIGVYEEADYPFINDEIELLQSRLQNDKPTLGICLGAQLMARALGAQVYPGGRKEIGWSPITLTAAGTAGPLRHLHTIDVLHWHGDTFDMPPGARHLASSQIYPHQAFAWGATGLALQFHPEVAARGLERWFIGHACELAGVEGLSVSELRRQTAAKAPALTTAARALWQEWLASIAQPPEFSAAVALKGEPE